MKIQPTKYTTLIYHLALTLSLSKGILERSKKSFNKFRTSADKKTNYNKLYIAALLTVTSTTFCMHTANKCNKAYVLTTNRINTVQGRREAYQKYCPTQINWDQPANKQTPKMELKPNRSQKNDCGYWSQYTNK